LGIDLDPPREEGLDWAVWDRYELQLMARRGHPAFQDGPVSMEAFLALGHILYHPPELSTPPLETAIRRLGIQRRFVAHVASIGALVAAAASSDAVVILPRTLGPFLSRLAPIEQHALPFEAPSLESYVWWSTKLTDDPAHAWFRALFMKARLDGAIVSR